MCAGWAGVVYFISCSMHNWCTVCCYCDLIFGESCNENIRKFIKLAVRHVPLMASRIKVVVHVAVFMYMYLAFYFTIVNVY